MAYITSDQVKAARKALKTTFPEFKFSVTGGNTSAITIAIMSGPLDMTKDATRGGYSEDCYVQLNPYYLSRCEHGVVYEGMKAVAQKAIAEAGNPYFDHSDIQSDYFHCAYYLYMHVGKWDKPYVKTA